MRVVCDRRGCDSYRQQVLGQGVRVAIEAAGCFGWDAYLGDRGAFVGMNGFGASGPADALYRLFGITADAVVAQAKRLLNAWIACLEHT